MKILGWTANQWAVVIERVNHRPQNFSEATVIRKDYLKRFHFDPADDPIILNSSGKDPREKDLEHAHEMMTWRP